MFACGTWKSGKILLENPESWALESGIQLKESRIQVPGTGIQYLSSGIQDCLGLPYIGTINSCKWWSSQSKLNQDLCVDQTCVNLS